VIDNSISAVLVGHRPASLAPSLARIPSSQTMLAATADESACSGATGTTEDIVNPLRTTNAAEDVWNETDDASEDNNPRRGKPGIVVFSGGTAFNAASAEMASRSVGMDLGPRENEGVSRSNSLSSMMDMIATRRTAAMATTKTNIDRGQGLKVWHVLPVTDDGGSTAEIVRLLGGPAVGDIRSRLLRLAPGTTREGRAVRRLLGHRLISVQSLDKKDVDGEVDHEVVSRMARSEWLDILDGGHESYQQPESLEGDDVDVQKYEHPLWKDVSAPYRSVSLLFRTTTWKGTRPLIRTVF
jgi:hypothetical protein